MSTTQIVFTILVTYIVLFILLLNQAPSENAEYYDQADSDQDIKFNLLHTFVREVDSMQEIEIAKDAINKYDGEFPNAEYLQSGTWLHIMLEMRASSVIKIVNREAIPL